MNLRALKNTSNSRHDFIYRDRGFGTMQQQSLVFMTHISVHKLCVIWCFYVPRLYIKTSPWYTDDISIGQYLSFTSDVLPNLSANKVILSGHIKSVRVYIHESPYIPPYKVETCWKFLIVCNETVSVYYNHSIRPSVDFSVCCKYFHAYVATLQNYGCLTPMLFEVRVEINCGNKFGNPHTLR